MEIYSWLFDADAPDDASSSSDNSYAEDLQIQEALQATLFIHRTPSSSSVQISQEICTENKEKAELHHAPSSSSVQVSCEICTEDVKKVDMFQLDGCPHSFCSDCIRKHVEYKLRENIIVISCPDQDCTNIIQPRSLKSVVLADVIERWEEAVAESTILASQKIRCPYEGCLEVLVNDGGGGGEVAVAECECPWCHRLFCAKCRVPWHEGFDCKEFQRFNMDKNRIEKGKLRLLAREKKWKKCPNCKVFVDKTGGCIHITCRCKFEFCYICGANWNESHCNTCNE